MAVPAGEEKGFYFDHCFNSFVPPDDPDHASQDTIWRSIGASMLENAYQGMVLVSFRLRNVGLSPSTCACPLRVLLSAGYNCALLAYGQTGAGKSYSVMGYGSEKGILPVMCENLFKRFETDPAVLGAFVQVSMLEIYNDKVCSTAFETEMIPGM